MRQDLRGTITPALTRVLLSLGVTTLRQLVDVTGPDLARVDDVAARLGTRSLRVVAQLLEGWRTVLSPEERKPIRDYSAGVVGPSEHNPFADISITLDLQDCEGPLLECEGESVMSYGTVSGKLLYRACVKVLNKKRRHSRSDTPWRDVFNLSDDVKPEWTALYKTPLTKKVADLQWRMLHGAAAVEEETILSVSQLPTSGICTVTNVCTTRRPVRTGAGCDVKAETLQIWIIWCCCQRLEEKLRQPLGSSEGVRLQRSGQRSQLALPLPLINISTRQVCWLSEPATPFNIRPGGQERWRLRGRKMG
ncbi:hypothetical protein AOLI_G00311200 [Acnodon oligacanthus]